MRGLSAAVLCAVVAASATAEDADVVKKVAAPVTVQIQDAPPLYPVPEWTAPGKLPFVRWTGGTLDDPELIWVQKRGGEWVEINRATGAMRTCRDLRFSVLQFCQGAKKR